MRKNHRDKKLLKRHKMTTMRSNAITKRQNNFTHADQLRKMQNKHI